MTNRRPRAEFSKRVKTQAWDRCGGRCEKCTAPLMSGHIHYDHVIPTSLTADNSLANCQVLCDACHAGKTKFDRKVIAKAHRIEERRIGIHKSKRWRNRLKKKLDGTVIDRETGEPA